MKAHQGSIDIKWDPGTLDSRTLRWFTSLGEFNRHHYGAQAQTIDYMDIQIDDPRSLDDLGPEKGSAVS